MSSVTVIDVDKKRRRRIGVAQRRGVAILVTRQFFAAVTTGGVAGVTVGRHDADLGLLDLEVLKLGHECEGEGDDQQGQDPLAERGSDGQPASPVVEPVVGVLPGNNSG